MVGVREGVKNRRGRATLIHNKQQNGLDKNLTFDSKMLLLWILSYIGNHIIRLCTVDKYSRGKKYIEAKSKGKFSPPAIPIFTSKNIDIFLLFGLSRVLRLTHFRLLAIQNSRQIRLKLPHISINNSYVNISYNA